MNLIITTVSNYYIDDNIIIPEFKKEYNLEGLTTDEITEKLYDYIYDMYLDDALGEITVADITSVEAE